MVIHNGNSPGVKKKRRLLSPEKKFQIFLESQTGKTPKGAHWRDYAKAMHLNPSSLRGVGSKSRRPF